VPAASPKHEKLQGHEATPERPVPTDLGEQARQRALDALRTLDTPHEQAFDDIVRLARDICGVPIALISLVDRDRQWFKAQEGLDVRETPRDVAFCDHAIRDPGQLMEVPDAGLDRRFSANPLVTGAPHIRFYAGAPLVTPEGEALGTVCVIDHQPRSLSAAQRGSLEALARLAVALLVARRRDLETIRAGLDQGLAARGGRDAGAPSGYGVAILQPRVARALDDGSGVALLVRVAASLEPLLTADEVLSGHGGHELILMMPGGGDASARLATLEAALNDGSGAGAAEPLPVAVGLGIAGHADEPMEEVFLRADEDLRRRRGLR
jgi:hypothetical protein